MDVMLFVAVTCLTLWRLFDWGGSGLVPLRWIAVATSFLSLLIGWQTSTVILLIAFGGVFFAWGVAFAPTPKWLRGANWFRAGSVREAVANSRTIWDSYSYHGKH